MRSWDQPEGRSCESSLNPEFQRTRRSTSGNIEITPLRCEEDVNFLKEPGVDDTVIMSDLFETYAASLVTHQTAQPSQEVRIVRQDSLAFPNLRRGLVSKVLTVLGF